VINHKGQPCAVGIRSVTERRSPSTAGDDPAPETPNHLGLYVDLRRPLTSGNRRPPAPAETGRFQKSNRKPYACTGKITCHDRANTSTTVNIKDRQSWPFTKSGRQDLNLRPLDPQDVGVDVHARQARYACSRRVRCNAVSADTCTACGPQVVPNSSAAAAFPIRKITQALGFIDQRPIRCHT
jgi:hypothetical protein